MEDDFVAQAFMPFKLASKSEMVHKGESLCSVERGVGGPDSGAGVGVRSSG
jgi:hypothetical protein